METFYSDGKTKPRVGDVVMAPGNMRGIVIALVDASLVKVLGIGTIIETGETFVLPQRYVQDYPANVCRYLERQTLSL